MRFALGITTLWFVFAVFLAMGTARAEIPPHIIFVLADDVGYADVCFGRRNCPIETPHMDALARSGRRLAHHYAHSTCTPSRASLMTGRYSANTGLNFPLMPGAIGGLPPNMATMPQVLRKQGYIAHMVGKWHIGHAQWTQTPVGRGFQSHVGNYLWSMEYLGKQLWELPWSHFCVDWVRAWENGTYVHYAEPRHSTTALTEEAIRVIRTHAATQTASNNNQQPLFLYLAYTAAHAPLEPLPEDEIGCSHLSHVWRRKYCGLVKGLDKSVGLVAAAVTEYLGNNAILVFSSDNGGAPWFGGLNYPLRSGKTMPFEGGIRVPAFVHDFTPKKVYIGGVKQQGSAYAGLMHISDWLPTLARIGGHSPADVAEYRFDGVDQSDALAGRTGRFPRTDMLVEMYYHSRGEFLFPEDVMAYRSGKYKLLEVSGMRDSHWYYEPTGWRLNSSDSSWQTWVGEMVIRGGEALTTAGKFDSIRDLLVHIGIHAWFRTWQEDAVQTMLFDLEADPTEVTNLAESLPEVVTRLRTKAYQIREARPKQQKWWMTIDRERFWKETLKSGDCSTNPHVPQGSCWFTHPWVRDDANLSEVALVNGAEAGPFLREIGRYVIPRCAPVALFFGVLAGGLWWMCRRSTPPKMKRT